LGMGCKVERDRDVSHVGGRLALGAGATTQILL
jgi:hypothetical protein